MALKPPVEVPQGAIRLNTDSQKLEFFAQDQWWEMETDTPILDGGVRGLFMGGNNGQNYNDINQINIATTGNAQDYGDLQANQTAASACSSSTRALLGGGQWPSVFSAHIMRKEIASSGNAVDFGGDLSLGRDFLSALSNATRGVWAGGRNTGPSPHGMTDRIDYVTISASSNAIDFGNLSINSLFYPMSLASSTRGVIGCGNGPSPNVGAAKNIDYITIASTGDASDFGDLTATKGGVGVSNSVRGIFAGGYLISGGNPAGWVVQDDITYITIATQGNTTDFGQLTRNVRSHGAASSSTRGVFGGGKQPSNSRTIDYVTIATTGSATDFGDLVGGNSGDRGNVAGCSNGHGGL